MVGLGAPRRPFSYVLYSFLVALSDVLHVFLPILCEVTVFLTEFFKEFFLRTVDTNPLLRLDVVNIFSQFVAYFFTFLLMPLEEHVMNVSSTL